MLDTVTNTLCNGLGRAYEYCLFFSSRRRHTRFDCDWSSDVCSSDLRVGHGLQDRRMARGSSSTLTRAEPFLDDRPRRDVHNRLELSEIDAILFGRPLDRKSVV